MVQRIKGLYITDTRSFQQVRQSGANADMVISIDVSVSVKNEEHAQTSSHLQALAVN